MFRLRSWFTGTLGLLVVAGLLAACAPAAAPTAAAPGAGGEPASPLRIALLPIVDALPMYVAEQEGLFKARGLVVDFTPVGSAAQRDQLVAAGQADGFINDMVSTFFYNKDEIRVQVVRYARTAGPNSPMYRILAAKNSGIKAASDLKGVQIGVSQGTVIEYMTDRLLQFEGLKPGDYQTLAVPNISDRMTLLNSGELKAATLPDPFFSLAQQQGASVLADDLDHPELSYSTIAFRKAVLDQRPADVRAFLSAIEEATQKLNAHPEAYRSLLADRKLIPAPLLSTYTIPTFPLKGVPTQAQFEDALNWAKGKGLITKDLAYQDSVTAAYLP